MKWSHIMRTIAFLIITLLVAPFVPLSTPLSVAPAFAQTDHQEEPADPIKDPEESEEPEKPKDPHRQRLGLRAGYVTTGSNISEVFGNGIDLSLHWIQRIKRPLAIDATIGAIYMGSTGREDITLQAFPGLRPDNVSMRVLHFTVAPMLEVGLGKKTHVFVSGGGGLYTVSLLVDQAFSEADFTNSHFGLTASAGVIRQISENWFIDASFQGHKMWTGTGPEDIFWSFSEQDSNPVFYDFTLGAMLRLF